MLLMAFGFNQFKINCAFVLIKMYNLFIKTQILFMGNDCAAADNIQSSLQMQMSQLEHLPEP